MGYRGWRTVTIALIDLLLAGVFCLESLELFFIQAGLLALGMALEGIALLLEKRYKSQKLRLLPLTLLALPLMMAIWEIIFPHGFLGGAFAAMILYIFPGIHYLVGWAAVYTLFPREKDNTQRETGQ